MERRNGSNSFEEQNQRQTNNSTHIQNNDEARSHLRPNRARYVSVTTAAAAVIGRLRALIDDDALPTSVAVNCETPGPSLAGGGSNSRASFRGPPEGGRCQNGAWRSTPVASPFDGKCCPAVRTRTLEGAVPSEVSTDAPSERQGGPGCERRDPDGSVSSAPPVCAVFGAGTSFQASVAVGSNASAAAAAFPAGAEGSWSVPYTSRAAAAMAAATRWRLSRYSGVRSTKGRNASVGLGSNGGCCCAGCGCCSVGGGGATDADVPGWTPAAPFAGGAATAGSSGELPKPDAAATAATAAAGDAVCDSPRASPSSVGSSASGAVGRNSKAVGGSGEVLDAAPVFTPSPGNAGSPAFPEVGKVGDGPRVERGENTVTVADRMPRSEAPGDRALAEAAGLAKRGGVRTAVVAVSRAKVLDDGSSEQESAMLPLLCCARGAMLLSVLLGAPLASERAASGSVGNAIVEPALRGIPFAARGPRGVTSRSSNTVLSPVTGMSGDPALPPATPAAFVGCSGSCSC